jgi:hypothetical protein
MSDSEPLKKPNDFIDMAVYSGETINFTYVIIVFFLFLFVSSNIFIDQVLSAFTDTSKGGQLTIKGILIQAIILCLLFIVFQIISNSGVL